MFHSATPETSTCSEPSPHSAPHTPAVSQCCVFNSSLLISPEGDPAKSFLQEIYSQTFCGLIAPCWRREVGHGRHIRAAGTPARLAGVSREGSQAPPAAGRTSSDSSRIRPVISDRNRLYCLEINGHFSPHWPDLMLLEC